MIAMGAKECRVWWNQHRFILVSGKVVAENATYFAIEIGDEIVVKRKCEVYLTMDEAKVAAMNLILTEMAALTRRMNELTKPAEQ